MAVQWRLSASAAKLLGDGIAQYLENPGAPDVDFCGVIGWSLGGELVLASGERHTIGPRYEIGITAISDIAEYGLARIDDPALGIVAFQPSAADLASDRRLIDYDGKDIVVR